VVNAFGKYEDFDVVKDGQKRCVLVVDLAHENYLHLKAPEIVTYFSNV
jgi:hypothetical protein